MADRKVRIIKLLEVDDDVHQRLMSLKIKGHYRNASDALRDLLPPEERAG